MEAKHILLIEDNLEDVSLMLKTLQQGQTPKIITVIDDGKQALAVFNSPGVMDLVPDLILLDIQLSGSNGLDILNAIKTHPLYRKIPVIVVTRSSAGKDILDAYQAYANCYIVKPSSPNSFTEVLQLIEEFWLNIVRLPKSKSV